MAGRTAFGPDGMLYATTGDAGDPDSAQDESSLSGKILRMTPTGGVPDDNPFPGSLVYSLGHRNPQASPDTRTGQLWAAEFGQDTWDEFNRIEPGGNYGWPVVEGTAADGTASAGYIDPWAQWPTDEASPSGLTYIDGTFFLAGLGGERLWAIYVDEDAGRADAVAWYAGEYGRLRDVAPGPDGSLWILTNNTDGRGSPREGDDRILQVRLTELREG
ncbi:MAG: PQQ-dependent sugar dehydrogenase [Schumannella sp.]